MPETSHASFHGPALPRRAAVLALLALALVSAACRAESGPGSSPAPTAGLKGTTPADASPTPLPPTPTASPTPVPLAAEVNGEPILLEDYQAHLARLQAAGQEIGRELPAAEASQMALADLIDQLLLAQTALEDGFQLDDQALEDQLAELREQAGGEAALAAWQQAHGYTPESFQRDLRRSLAAAWMRDQIAATVPEAMAQVHARQILLFDRASAEDVERQLLAGQNFETLARAFDPQGLGDLGWFPQGFLLEPAVEAAAFELAPGEFSTILETQLGFHLIQVIERDEARPLDQEARLTLQIQALEAWLSERRAESEIEIFLPDPP